MQKAALYTAAAIFGLGAVAHAVRLVTGFPIVIDGIDMPVWASVVAAVVAALLAVWMAVAARRS